MSVQWLNLLVLIDEGIMIKPKIPYMHFRVQVIDAFRYIPMIK